MRVAPDSNARRGPGAAARRRSSDLRETDPDLDYRARRGSSPCPARGPIPRAGSCARSSAPGRSARARRTSRSRNGQRRLRRGDPAQQRASRPRGSACRRPRRRARSRGFSMGVADEESMCRLAPVPGPAAMSRLRAELAARSDSHDDAETPRLDGSPPRPTEPRQTGAALARPPRLGDLAQVRGRGPRLPQLLVPGDVEQARQGAKPLAVTLAGEKIMLIREKGVVRALHDRCPHRGVPASAIPMASQELPGHVDLLLPRLDVRPRDRRARRGDHRRPRVAHLRQGRRADLPRRGAARPRLRLAGRRRARRRSRTTSRRSCSRRRPSSWAGSPRGRATGASAPRTASTTATPSTCTATRSGRSA